MKVVALAGGVGGAKLADGLERVVGEDLTVVVNTADDFEWQGLHVSPDLDTVMYTLAGLANRETGWGIAGDTFNALGMISGYGEEAWFQVGDRDLATHVLRTRMLREGRTLTEATRSLSGALGVRAAVLPMTDSYVHTVVDTDEGELGFQEYFVSRRWQPSVRTVRFKGIEESCATRQVLDAVERADAIILCPSNPFLSIEPILAVQGIREHIGKSKAFRVAVSPIVGGQAVKGPAAKIFRELGIEPSATLVAARYRGIVDGLVLDKVDAAQQGTIEAMGMRVLASDTIMANEADRERLAREVIDWATASAAL